MILIFGGGSDIAKAINGKLITHKACDVRLIKAVDYLIKRFKPSVVVNCAGISITGTVKEQDSESWIKQIEINLIGSYNIAKACVDNKVPKLVLIASVAGKYGKPNHSAYSVSKAGVISLVQSLGKEGYKAYCISPGRVDTKMREHDYPNEDKRTRLSTKNVADVIFDCIKGRYKPGDNVIVRKRGFRRMRRIDRGQPWKGYLNL